MVLCPHPRRSRTWTGSYTRHSREGGNLNLHPATELRNANHAQLHVIPSAARNLKPPFRNQLLPTWNPDSSSGKAVC